MTPRRLILPLLAVTALATPALAATPEAGTLSKSTPQVKWTGTSSNGGLTTIPAVANSGAPACVSPSCDTFTATVADAGGDLKIKADAPDTGGFLMIQIVKPDGSEQYSSGEEGKTSNSVAVKNAPAGEYQIQIAANAMGDVDYSAVADLVFAPAEPDPAAPAPTATPAPGAQPTPAPAPAQPASATIAVKAGRLSAKKVSKQRRAAVTVSSDRTVYEVSVKLLKGKKAVGSAALASLTGSKKVNVRVGKRIKAGSYVLVVSAKDGSATVSSRIPVKIAK